MIKYKKGFYLYLWLTLFTLFISFFSIILFNYVSSDIRTTKELIRESKRASDLKSLILIATNIYRQDYTKDTGNIPYKGKSYKYQIKNINGQHIYVKILDNNNSLLAKAIVLYKINIGNYNKLATNYNNYYFNNSSYYSNTTFLADRIDIEQTNIKIFNNLLLKYNTQPYRVTFDSYGNPIYTQITDKEITKNYTEKLYRVDLDPITYYNNFLAIVMQQLYETPNNDVELNTKGALIVKKSNSEPTILFKPDEANHNNQKIEIKYNDDLKASFTLVRYPQNFEFNKRNDTLITNDRQLAAEITNLINDNRNRDTFTITLNPSSNYVYKFLKRGNNYIICKTQNSLIYILVFANPIIGTDNNLSTNNGIIKEKIYLITDKSYFTTIKGHILYEETANNISDNNLIIPTEITPDNIKVSNNNNLFTLVTNNINIDGSNFNDANPYIILCGKYVAMYNNNSKLSLINSGSIDKMYIYGGIHSSISETTGLKEYYINDKRLAYIDPLDLLNIHTDRIIAIDFNY